MNGENIKSRCDFIGLINNNLCCKYKECEKIWLKPLSSSLAYLELTKKNAKHAWKEKTLNQNVNLLDLKITN